MTIRVHVTWSSQSFLMSFRSANSDAKIGGGPDADGSERADCAPEMAKAITADRSASDPASEIASLGRDSADILVLPPLRTMTVRQTCRTVEARMDHPETCPDQRGRNPEIR
jgi:hypothetical protein